MARGFALNLHVRVEPSAHFPTAIRKLFSRCFASPMRSPSRVQRFSYRFAFRQRARLFTDSKIVGFGRTAKPRPSGDTAPSLLPAPACLARREAPWHAGPSQLVVRLQWRLRHSRRRNRTAPAQSLRRKNSESIGAQRHALSWLGASCAKSTPSLPWDHRRPRSKPWPPT